jgi:hypothetical protein
MVTHDRQCRPAYIIQLLLSIVILLWASRSPTTRPPKATPPQISLPPGEELDPLLTLDRLRRRRRRFILYLVMPLLLVGLAYWLIAPTWSRPAELDQGQGFISVWSSCPRLQAIPHVVVLQHGQRMRVSIQVVETGGCHRPTVTVGLYGDAILHDAQPDAPRAYPGLGAAIKIGPAGLATVRRPGLEPLGAIGLQQVTYQVSPRGFESFAIEGTYLTRPTTSWKAWSTILPTLWVQCHKGNKWTAAPEFEPKEIRSVRCPNTPLEDPSASVGLLLDATERVANSSAPSDRPRGNTSFVLYRNMLDLIDPQGFQVLNPWSDPNSIGGVKVDVVNRDRDQVTAFRYLLAGGLLGLCASLIVAWLSSRFEGSAGS